MAVDFDALVLGPCMDAFAYPALLMPLVSAPGSPPRVVRGVFKMAGEDILGDHGDMLRADGYTFGVRMSEFGDLQAARGDLLSNVQLPSGFLDGRTFEIEDTGDADGMGLQVWILKEHVDDPDGYPGP